MKPKTFVTRAISFDSSLLKSLEKEADSQMTPQCLLLSTRNYSRNCKLLMNPKSL